MFEGSSSIHYGPLSSFAGVAGSRPNSAVDVQSRHPHDCETPVAAASAGSNYRETPTGEFDLAITVDSGGIWNEHQPRFQPQAQHQLRQTMFTYQDTPVYSVEWPSYQPNH
ncbi:hypothetical protein QBC36DRAFT_299518 [Triangularia setosa]|uniref:Uncharacterized protein n=1 Tax=Triangularia setosa TaxID=2587417 RepID=A0AAN6WAI0_9PEZI|nr:hypothetical protein QBC36DRAFT_299518 [Podospora setosa]